MSDPLEALYARPLPAGRHGALYNAFSYPTKISAESVAVFIACHTRPGDRVLDVFGGSGTTGIAALLCERPTATMLRIADDAGLKPVWGKRDATVYELSEIGSLLGRVMTHAPEPSAFRSAAQRLIERAEAIAGDGYASPGPDGESGQVRHIIWSDLVTCPNCRHVTTYADVRVRYSPLRFDDTHTCSECGVHSETAAWQRVNEVVKDPWTGASIERRARVPWRVYGKGKGGNWVRPATSADAAAEADSVKRPLPKGAPISELRWGDLYRSGYHRGISHLHHLYTARNFYALATLWSLIDDEPEGIRDALRLFVLSYNASHSTLMTRVVLKKNSTDFVLTGAQSGVLYVSGLPVEKNVFAGLRRKIGVFANAFDLLFGTEGSVDVVTGSSTRLSLPDESVDYVFTDPPFGGYIPYSEINQINELWLGRPTQTADEAIVSPAQGKGLADYERLLAEVFAETARVMKPVAEATLVFHSAHASVWQALSASLAKAGLSVTSASVLDKTQASFKQVNGHVAVSGDPLLRVQKRGDALTESVTATMETLAEDASHVADVPASKRQRERVYSRLVGEALVLGVPVTLDARDFYLQQRVGGGK